MDNVLNLKEPQSLEEVQEESAPETAEEVVETILGPEAVSWQASYPPHETRMRKRYIAFGVFALAGGAVAIWQSSILMGVLVIVGIAAWEIHERFAQPVSVVLDAHGLSVNGHQYTHPELVSFDIHTMPDGGADLSVKTERRSIPVLKLPLGDQDQEVVRAVFSRYVPYERHPISRIDYWMRS
jgi:hypothetical protein